MSRRLRVLTYNVQFRSWGMEAGAQTTLTPITSVETRANLIADRILAASEPWDVLCFNEVFDEDGRDVLHDRLRGAYPNIVVKADADDRLSGALELAGGLAMAGSVWGLALGSIGVGSWLSAKWEDSGLMMFSKHPFAQEPLPQAVIDAQSDLGVANPITAFPKVAFVPYEDAEDNDASAAKGVVYAQIDAGDWPFHLLMSHTQADPTTDIGKRASVRRKQFATVEKLLEGMVGEPGPWHEEILFCGDLNVQGVADAAGTRPEWHSLFEDFNSPLTKFLQDAWDFEQCPGRAALGETPLPADCDRGYSTIGQRLDYMIRPVHHPEKLVAQHIRIAHDVAQAAAPGGQTLYTSDHRPLSIDLNERAEHNTVLTAEQLSFTVDQPEVQSSDTLLDGRMHWYRIDDPGGYGFALTSGADKVDYAVYTKDDLSTPYTPFTTETTPATREGPPLTRYALANRPFFVRVWLKKGVRRATYTLFTRRFVGSSRADAIPMLHAWPQRGEARVGAEHSDDDPNTRWNEFDCVWHVARLDGPPAGATEIHTTVTLDGIEDNAFGLLLLRDRGPTDLEELGEFPAGVDPIKLSFVHDRPGWVYVLARREDAGAFVASAFTLRLDDDVSYLYSRSRKIDPLGHALNGDARLMCIDETDGFLGSESGSDDIQVNVGVAGQNVVHVPNSDDLEFDDDTQRDLPMPTVAYAGDATFELVELDDLSAADRASVTIPQHAGVTQNITGQDGPTKRAIFKIDFGDGEYWFEATVSPEPSAG